MSGRSSVRDLVTLAAALAVTAACGKSGAGKAKPEADPAEVAKLAARMLREVPTPAAVRECVPGDFDGGVAMTWRTLTQIGGGKLPTRVEDQEWINPHELDAPAARTLADSASPAGSAGSAATNSAGKDKKLVRQAAAELLAAPSWIVYKVDYVNAPMALGVKELKIGTVGTRIIRYEKTGQPACVQVWFFQNDQKISDDAIAVSDKAAIDPAVAKILRDDLVHQFITQAPRPGAAGSTGSAAGSAHGSAK